MPSSTPQRNPHAVILWLNDYRLRKLRLSICALAATMTRAGYAIKCRTLTHVFTHAAERAAGLTTKRGQPRDITVAVIVDYCQYLRANAKRRAARRKRAPAPAPPPSTPSPIADRSIAL